MSTGCLITDPPQFKPPKHTRPWLDPITATPDPQLVVVIDDSKGLKSLTFSADVTSQDDTDDGPFSKVDTRLYIDLGIQNPFDPTTPYVHAIDGDVLLPGSLDQTGRRTSAVWNFSSRPILPGCHRATLVVSHIFDRNPDCPVCPDDFTAITWQILRCNGSDGDCGELLVDSCPELKSSCATVRDELMRADAGIAQCPSDADAGAP